MERKTQGTQEHRIATNLFDGSGQPEVASPVVGRSERSRPAHVGRVAAGGVIGAAGHLGNSRSPEAYAWKGDGGAVFDVAAVNRPGTIGDQTQPGAVYESGHAAGEEPGIYRRS